MRDEDFERLYAEHAEPLFAFLVYRTGDRSLAEDLTADAFERALRSRGRFDRRRGTGKQWLFAIALNLLRDQHRRAGAEQRALFATGEGLAEAGEGGQPAVDDRDELAQALSVLSDEEREAIALRYGADLTVPEIARLLGVKLTTMEGRVYRALGKLRDELEPAAEATAPLHPRR